MQRDENLS